MLKIFGSLKNCPYICSRQLININIMKRCDICGQSVARGKRHRGCNALFKAASGQKLTPKETKRAGQTLISHPELTIICPNIIGK